MYWSLWSNTNPESCRYDHHFSTNVNANLSIDSVLVDTKLVVDWFVQFCILTTSTNNEVYEMLKIIYVTVDFDHPTVSSQIIPIEERDRMDDCIEEEEGKEVNTFDAFLKELDTPVDFVKEIDNLKTHVEKVLTSHDVLESYTFSSGELGHGFYAVVNDKDDILDVEELIDFM